MLVYQDWSTCRVWPVKKAIVILPIRIKQNSNALRLFIASVGGREQGYQCCFAAALLLTEVELSATQAILTVTTLSLNYLLVHDSLSLKSTCTN